MRKLYRKDRPSASGLDPEAVHLWNHLLPDADLLVSVDLPEEAPEYVADHAPLDVDSRTDPTRVDFVEAFDEKRVRTIKGNAHAEPTVERVGSVLDSREIDFLFLDGDWRYESVKHDLDVYGEYLADDGLVAVHDIAHPSRGQVTGGRRW